MSADQDEVISSVTGTIIAFGHVHAAWILARRHDWSHAEIVRQMVKIGVVAEVAEEAVEAMARQFGRRS